MQVDWWVRGAKGERTEPIRPRARTGRRRIRRRSAELVACDSRDGLDFVFGVVSCVLRELREDWWVVVYVERATDSGVACGTVKSTQLKIEGRTSEKV